jgi:hypothetical protein
MAFSCRAIPQRAISLLLLIPFAKEKRLLLLGVVRRSGRSTSDVHGLE